VNNAERRLQEVEERLKSFEAPEPPASLLESIQAEIPEDLAGTTTAPDVPFSRRFLKLAASLAVIAVGGVLGYRLLEEGPAPGDALAPEVPIETSEVVIEAPGLPIEEKESEKTPSKAEMGEQAPAERRDPAPRPEIGGEVGTVGQPVSEHRREPPSEAAHSSTGSVQVDVKDESGSAIPGTKVTLLGQGASSQRHTDVEGKARFDDVASGEYGLTAELEGFLTVEHGELEVGESRDVGVSVTLSLAQEETITVTSESPVLDDRRLEADGATSLVLLEKIPAAQASRKVAMGRPVTASPSTGGTAEPNDQPYGDMLFRGYGTNPFVDTEDDPQSTFGIDVDTASYTMARSYLRRGDLPPADAIRVEEFVNFFDYGDRAPSRRDFAVVAEGAPSPFASTARTYLLRFALQGREVSDRQRNAAVLTFVVDVSGSMNRENRLGLVQRALGLLVDQLDEGDAIGLVVYGSRGQVILEPTSDHRRVMAAIRSLRLGGSTNAEEGLVFGYQTARRFFRPGAINRVILCSDGVANVGRTGPNSILARIAREADAGIELTTVGFGMGNYNDVLMEQLADKGDGNYAYVDDIEEARRVFVENLTGTLQTIAGDAKVQVEFDPQIVQSYRLLGYENRDIADRDFRNDAVDAGEIGAGHQVTALYEVKMRDGAPKRGKVATLRLRYHSKRSGKVVEDAVDLHSSDLVSRWSGASRGLQLAAVAAEFAEVLRGSYWAREGSLSELESRARGLARSGAWGSDVAELAELISTAARLTSAADTPLDGDGIER
jgi:Ca-activated chloride channel family protein